MRASDQSIVAGYAWTTSTVASPEFMDKMGTPMRLGEAPGYTNPREAALFLSCYAPTAVESPWLEVSMTRYRDPGGVKPDAKLEVDRERDPALMAELVADAARYLAQQLKCEVAPRLPSGPPTIGPGAAG
ncbi:hypothetical protein ACFWBN_18055 [Streptomyces sp. NPDC059989]|uniref:hypothetical protein n=1 Tax=Streptomyces sp. NPDC059989 TaxID=3347026 RepID=UPI0036C59391